MASGFRFRRSFKILPGLRLNISKKSASLSIGPDVAHVTVGTAGARVYMNLPGAGMYYTQKIDTKTSKTEAKKTQEQDKLKLGFLQKLMAPPEQVRLVEALRAYAEGNLPLAYQSAKEAANFADGAFLAGFLAIQQGLYQEAAQFLQQAWSKQVDLNRDFATFEVDMTVDLPITEGVYTQIRPDHRGVLLALARAYEEIGLEEMAIEALKHLRQYDPNDLVVRLMLAELLTISYPDAQTAQVDVVKLAEDVSNISPIHAALMFYRARALRKLGMIEGALDTVKRAQRRRKGYPADLIHALAYERACLYELTGKPEQARKEFEKIFADSPNYEDVAAKLGF